MFLFVVVSRQTKKGNSLRPLWFGLAYHLESIEGRLRGEQIIICVSLRKSAANYSLTFLNRRLTFFNML